MKQTLRVKDSITRTLWGDIDHPILMFPSVLLLYSETETLSNVIEYQVTHCAEIFLVSAAHCLIISFMLSNGII